ncbi:MAG: hypothetical protein ACTHK2_14035 [Dokdonella sp.]|uniref:hypothetical protein n=1 Tax=Dokdonella sp. TaxID=2291710 RepID=UPI003F7F2386
MKFFGKTLGLLLASLALASCGGGGGDGGTFTPQSGSITITATATSLPTNTGNWLPTQHGPNQAELTITTRNADGSLLIGEDLSVSISPVNVASLSFLVNDDNDDGDNLWGSFTIKGTNGVATAWVNAGTVAGTAVVTASMVDPTTDRTISKTITITVTSGVGTNPATVSLTPTPAGVYLPNSGGNNVSSIAAVVLDGGGQFVPDPVGADNLQVEIVGNAGDARLSTNSSGGASQGTTVSTHTVNGKATISFQAGDATPQEPVQIKATADRADNNVSNGIQDPVSFTTSVVVSDGKLFSIKITSPDVNAILANTVSGDVSADFPPLDPDGTYSLTVSALGTDRQGNPVLPGTPIRFGSIDEPVGTFDAGANANRFLIAGGDGNPQEGGTGFTAPTGHFRTAGGGAGPGDAIIVFGKTQHGAPQGNEDLESALTVGRVNSETSLNTTTPFNNNNTTGSSVDYGPVLDYIVGRSNHGNITAGAFTNDVGVAHAELTYTVETLGHIVAMWAQGDGTDRVTNGSRRVTDAVQLLYPGIAPAQLVAFPSPIPGNTTTNVTVCLADALNSPIQGVRIGYQMDLSGGTGSIDGNGASGALDNTTGPDGCADATVVTSGMPVSTADSPSGKITFGVGGATAEVDIIVQLGFLSNAGLGRICTNATPTVRATIKAFTTTGDPAGGVQITAACNGVTANPSTATTSGNGSAVFDISGTPGASGTCTFSAEGVAPLNVQVTIPDADDFSPPCGP